MTDNVIHNWDGIDGFCNMESCATIHILSYSGLGPLKSVERERALKLGVQSYTQIIKISLHVYDIYHFMLYSGFISFGTGVVIKLDIFLQKEQKNKKMLYFLKSVKNVYYTTCPQIQNFGLSCHILCLIITLICPITHLSVRRGPWRIG